MQVCLPTFPALVLAWLFFFLRERSSSVPHWHSLGTVDANSFSKYHELLDWLGLGILRNKHILKILVTSAYMDFSDLPLKPLEIR